MRQASIDERGATTTAQESAVAALWQQTDSPKFLLHSKAKQCAALP